MQAVKEDNSRGGVIGPEYLGKCSDSERGGEGLRCRCVIVRWKGRPGLGGGSGSRKGKLLSMKKSLLSEWLPGLIAALLSVMGLMVLR